MLEINPKTCFLEVFYELPISCFFISEGVLINFYVIYKLITFYKFQYVKNFTRFYSILFNKISQSKKRPALEGK